MNPPTIEAKRLYHIFLTCQSDKYLAKQATLFCVGEIMKEYLEYINPVSYDCDLIMWNNKISYLKRVKRAIQKL